MQEIPIHTFGVSVFVLRDASDGKRLLLLRRSERYLNGEWCQVAGAIEQGEKAWQTALRELKEETGLIPLALYSADICEQYYEFDSDHVCILPVFIAMVDGEAKIELNDEHSDYRWVTQEEAESLLPFPGQRHVLRHVWSEFVDRKPLEQLRIPLAK